jgi:hypothetical protein
MESDEKEEAVKELLSEEERGYLRAQEERIYDI